MKKMKNLYEILGVSMDATSKEIKSAYCRLAKKYHPDAYPDRTFTEEEEKEMRIKFTEVVDAYKILKNENLRRTYDINFQLNEERRKREEAKAREAHRRERVKDYGDFFKEVDEDSKRNTSKTKKRRTKKHTVFSTIRDSYREVKEDEAKIPFSKRHSNMNQKYYNKYASKVDNVPELVLFRTGQISSHILMELIYQLSKLSYINKDNVVKFTIRNRIFLASLAALIIVLSHAMANTNENGNVIDSDLLAGEDQSVVSMNVDSEDVNLIEIHTIEFGESLSSLSIKSNSTINSIKSLNGLKSDTIYAGSKIKVPYYIAGEDLKYYTKVVSAGNLSIYELANMYSTDVDTIISLNKDAVTSIDGVSVLMTDSVVVPEFISRKELTEKKGYTKRY